MDRSPYWTRAVKRLETPSVERAQALVDAFNARYPYLAKPVPQAGSEASEEDQ